MDSFQSFIAPPIALNFKEKLLAIVTCFLAILLIGWLTQYFVDYSAFPVLVASMGASAVILFILPTSPFAQPWSFLGGQLSSAVVGVFCSQTIPDVVLASACAAGGSVCAMLVLRCLHPPGAATAIAPVIAGNAIHNIGFDFVVFPVTINVVIMLCLSVLINRWLMRRDYPVYGSDNKSQSTFEEKNDIVSGFINDEDVSDVLNDKGSLIDISVPELKKLLIQIEQRRYKRLHGIVNCGQVMETDIFTVEYGTSVEEAWELLYQHKLHALPVIDKASRVIGIVSRTDFLKSVNLSAYDSLQDKIRAFIRQSREVSTDKPEYIGHIMTKQVFVLEEKAHIAELIPLMANTDIHQVPIVNDKQRIVGMVYQHQLIAAFYYQQNRE